MQILHTLHFLQIIQITTESNVNMVKIQSQSGCDGVDVRLNVFVQPSLFSFSFD